MRALRWILLCLVAFGAGTGAAFALHPPTVGIPKSSARDLASDLSAIRTYAAQGRCQAVRGHLESAAATIDDLPVSTSQHLQNQLSSSLSRVRSASLEACQAAADAQLASNTPATTPEPSTPDTTPEPPDTTPQESTPDTSSPSDGSPDGTSTDGGVSTDGGDQSGDGSGDQSGDQSGSDGSGDPGGVTLPNGVKVPGADAVRQRLHDLHQRLDQALGQR